MFSQAVIRTNYPYTIESVAGSNEDIITLAEIKEWLRLDIRALQVCHYGLTTV